MITAGLLLVWIASVVVAVLLGRQKHRRGLPYGLLLSWIGVVVLALLPPGHMRAREEVRGAKWDETYAPSQEPQFKNRMYYSHH